MWPGCVSGRHVWIFSIVIACVSGCWTFSIVIVRFLLAGRSLARRSRVGGKNTGSDASNAGALHCQAVFFPSQLLRLVGLSGMRFAVRRAGRGVETSESEFAFITIS